MSSPVRMAARLLPGGLLGAVALLAFGSQASDARPPVGGGSAPAPLPASSQSRSPTALTTGGLRVETAPAEVAVRANGGRVLPSRARVSDVAPGPARIGQTLTNVELGSQTAPGNVEPVSTVRLPLKGSPASPAETPGEWTNPTDGSVLIRIPAGSFRMGSDDGESEEKPVHDVMLKAYSIGKHEVTWRQYREFGRATGRQEPDAPGFEHGDDHPVVNVSWEDAAAYCAWAGLRLPTEAEWEYAARGTDGRKYSWGNEAPNSRGKVGNFADAALTRTHDGWPTIEGYNDGFAETAPVGSFPSGASPFGVLDMAGNAWEWCADWFDSGYYALSSRQSPTGPECGAFRVLRGGGWDSPADFVRAAARAAFIPSGGIWANGFRVAR